jgi:hypothetical protein
MTDRRPSELAIGVLAVALGVALWAATAGFPDISVEGTIGGDVWPRVLAIGLVALGAVQLVMAALGRVPRPEADPVTEPERRRVIAGVIVLLVAYLPAWSVVGFLPATIVAFVLIAKAFEIGAWWRALVWGVVLPAVVWIIFGVLLGVPL